jgi:hypothetical protein
MRFVPERSQIALAILRVCTVAELVLASWVEKEPPGTVECLTFLGPSASGRILGFLAC